MKKACIFIFKLASVIAISISVAYVFSFQLRKDIVGNSLLTKNQIESIYFILSRLDKRVENQGKELEAIKPIQSYEASRLAEQFPSIGEVKPQDSRYIIISCKSGLFAVICKGIKPYSTGSEIDLQVVNMYSVRSTSIFRVFAYKYSIDDISSNATSYEGYNKNIRKYETELKDLEPGISKSIKARIPDLKPDQVKEIRVSVNTQEISFFKER